MYWYVDVPSVPLRPVPAVGPADRYALGLSGRVVVCSARSWWDDCAFLSWDQPQRAPRPGREGAPGRAIGTPSVFPGVQLLQDCSASCKLQAGRLKSWRAAGGCWPSMGDVVESCHGNPATPATKEAAAAGPCRGAGAQSQAGSNGPREADAASSLRSRYPPPRALRGSAFAAHRGLLSHQVPRARSRRGHSESSGLRRHRLSTIVSETVSQHCLE